MCGLNTIKVSIKVCIITFPLALDFAGLTHTVIRVLGWNGCFESGTNNQYASLLDGIDGTDLSATNKKLF